MSIQGFNDAVSIIVDSALDKRKFDTTITCEIITAPNENATDQTYYVVESDKIRFGAYSDGSKYRIGDTVNVLIPGGDYNNRKTIMNKLTTVDEIPETSDVLHNSDGFAAAWYKDSIEIGYTIPGPDRRIHIFPNKQLQIKLSADVQSSSEDFTVNCEITGKTIENKDITVSCSWYSDDMIGNVSKFAFPFYQEIILTNKELQKLNTINNITITQTDSSVQLFNLSFAIGYLKEDLEDGLYIVSANGKYTYTEDALIRKDLELIWIDGGKFKNQNINIELLNDHEYNINGEIWRDTTGDYMINCTRLIEYGAQISEDTAIVPELYYNMCKGLKVGSKKEDDDTFIVYNEVSYDINDDLVLIPDTNEYMYILQGGIYAYEEGYVNDLTNPLPLYRTHWKQQGKINEIIMRKDFADSTIKAIIRNDNKTTKAEVNQTLTNSSWNSESAAVDQPDYLTLAAPKTYYPVYNNYGSMVDTTQKTVSATRSDGQAFEQKYITWKFDLTKLMQFPYHPTKKDDGSWEWYPKLPEGAIVRWEQGGETTDITSLDGWNEDSLLNIGVGYLTLPISEPARPQSISFYFKSELDVGNKATLTAYVHNNENIVTAYSGAITFTFGFADTFGTGYSFNIISNNDYESFSGQPSSEEEKEFEAILTTPIGEVVNLSQISDKLRWYWLHETVHSEIIDGKKPFQLLSIKPIVDYTEMYYRIFLESQIVDGLYTYNSETGEYVNAVDMVSGGDYYTKKIIATGNKCKVIRTDNTDDYNLNYHILVAELKNWPLADGRLVTLKAYRPMILSTLGNINLNDIQGSTYMIYDTMGNRIGMNDEGLKYSIQDELVNPFVVKLKRNSGELESIEATEIKIENGIMKQPELNPTSDGSIFTLKLSDSSDAIRWIQIPLMITTNTWFSERINNWDGSVKIDTEDNYILSAMVGAGKKNSDNQFTGVIMGEVGTDLRNAESGIYGFKDGQRTFSVSAETGSAYFSGKIESREGEIAGWILQQSTDQDKIPFLYSIVEEEQDDQTKKQYASGLSNGDVILFVGAEPENNLINMTDTAKLKITKDGSITTNGSSYLNGIKLDKFDDNKGGFLYGSGEGNALIKTGQSTTTQDVTRILDYAGGKRGHSTYNCKYHIHNLPNGYVHTYYQYDKEYNNWYNYVYQFTTNWDTLPINSEIIVNGYNGSVEIFAIQLTDNNLKNNVTNLWNGVVHSPCLHSTTDTLSIGNNSGYNCIIVNTKNQSSSISVSIKYTISIAGNENVVNKTYSNSYRIQSDGLIWAGPWCLTGLGLIGYDDNKNPKTLLRPDGFYIYDKDNKYWQLKNEWGL